MSTGAKKENQTRTDQVPTLTEKSSGVNYLENSIQDFDQSVGQRAPVTKNDKG